jgi:putative transposase
MSEVNIEHDRRSIRLRGYDYSSSGMYFATVCTEGKVCLFGEIGGGEMKLNSAGQAVVETWNSIPERFPAVEVDAYAVMPNHLHGLIFLVGNSFGGGEGAASSAPTSVRPTLGRIMRAFKSISAIRVNEISGRKGRAVWQRNYFEHIVRRGKDLADIRRYIAENPSRWGSDLENQERIEKNKI